MTTANNPRQLLAAIGVQFSEEVTAEHFKIADIERALIEGARAIANGDLRIVNPLFTWIQKNGEYVNVERLKKFVKSDPNPHQIFWIHALAFFGMSLGQTRWKILGDVQKIPRCLKNNNQDPVEALVDARFLQKLKGEADWSKETGFVLAKTSIQTASKYSLDKLSLAKVSLPFRNRLLFGPNWRADIATAISNGAKSAKEVRQLTGCSHEPAHRIFSELMLFKEVIPEQY